MPASLMGESGALLSCDSDAVSVKAGLRYSPEKGRQVTCILHLSFQLKNAQGMEWPMQSLPKPPYVMCLHGDFHRLFIDGEDTAITRRAMVSMLEHDILLHIHDRGELSEPQRLATESETLRSGNR